MLRFPKPLVLTALRWAGLVVAATLCQSFFWSDANPPALKLLVAVVALLATVAPDVGFLILAAAVPFGRIISSVASPGRPVDITEAIVLAYLAGWLCYRLRNPVKGGPHSPGLSFAWLFAAVVAASLLVEIGVLRYWRDYWTPFLRQLLTYLGRDYLNAAMDFRPWAKTLGGLVSATAAAGLLEGLALMGVVRALRQRDPAFGRRLLQVLAIAAVGTAMLSVVAAVEMAAAQTRGVLSLDQGARISAHLPKVNTAASSFVLFLPIVIGLAPWSGAAGRRSSLTRVLQWVAAVVGSGLLLAALWLAGSRTAMAAGAVVAVGAALYSVAGGRGRPVTWRSTAVIISALCLVAALLAGWFYARTAALEAVSGTRGSLPARVLLWRAALTTLAARPIFGVGIGQFQYQVAGFDPGVTGLTEDRFSRFNAHNQFLQVAAELGVVGGLLFIGMFAAILWRAGAAFRADRDPALGATIGGVLAFLITCLGGQPLLYEVVAFPFWMVVGVALAEGEMPPRSAPKHGSRGGRRFTLALIAGFLIVLAASIPFRVWQGRDRVNFALANYGFSEWQYPDYGRPFRLVRSAGTFFTYPHAAGIKLPIRRDVEAARNPLEVRVSLDGRLVRTLSLTNDEWQTLQFMIPADPGRRFRQVDLAILAPSGVTPQVRVGPAEISEGETVEPGRAR